MRRDWKLENAVNGEEISTVPFRTDIRGLFLEVVYNFRTDFLENCCSI